MDIQRLRNLTTGRLHTEIGCFHEDLELVTGERGLLRHMLPRVLQSIEPWLMAHVPDQRFWDGKLDVSHTGEYGLPEPTAEERGAMLERYAELSRAAKPTGRKNDG